MIDFEPDPSDVAFAARTSEFVRTTVMPYERDPRWGSHGPTDELRDDLVRLASVEQLLSPHVPKEFGGHGLTHRGRALVFDAAGYSMLGPVALNIAAPDEGNAHLLAKVATPEQQLRWLEPLARGEIRTAFAMTEPAPGAGSDPSMLTATATRRGDRYIVRGRKWLITGAKGAAVFIVMAQDSDVGGATMFLVPADRAGLEVGREITTLDSAFVSGHAVVDLHDVEVSVDEVLGVPGAGLRNAQVRLAPARLTHCMRWLGAARRAHDVAAEYAGRRTGFGRPIGEHEGVGFMLARNEVELRQAELMIDYVAWTLDQGSRASTDSSMAKYSVSESLFQIVDRCVQVLGGQGIVDETQVSMIWREIRGFRVYDGPSEVHLYSLARRLKRHG